MRSKVKLIIVALFIFILAMPVSQALQMQAPIPADWAYISGVVTYNGKVQDGVSVFLPGGTQEGNSFKTKDGGYYKLSAYPNIAVSITATYQGTTMTRSMETGGEGSNTTFNIDLTSAEGPATPTPAPGTPNIVLIGTVMYDDSPLKGVIVNISPVTKVKTDSTGQYMAMIPGEQNLTISVVTDTVTISRNVTTPAEGTSFVVDLNYTSPAPTVTVTPVVSPADSTPSPVPIPAPAGSESLIILSAVGLLAAIGLTRIRKE